MDLVLTHTNGEYLYQACYQLASLLSFLIFLWVGVKRKYAIHNWLLIGTSAFVLMMIGMHLGTLSLEKWKIFFEEGILPRQTGRTSIGALIGFFLGIWGSQKLLKTNYPVLDTFAFILPIALIVQRLGCLFAGCCFGLPTNTDFGIQYADHFFIFDYQEIEGLLLPGSETSSSVHPVPLYLIFVNLIVFILVATCHKKFKHRGSLFAFAVLINITGRFFVEFFRDPITNHQMGQLTYGLKQVQWLLLAMGLLTLCIIIFRERRPFTSASCSQNYSIRPQMFLYFTIILVVVIFMFLFNTVEIRNIVFRLFCLGGALIFVIIRKRYYLNPEFAVAILPALLLIGMSQTSNTNNAREAFPRLQDDYGSLEIGGALGKITSTKYYYTGGYSGCYGDTYSPRTLSRKEVHETNRTIGIKYEHSFIKSNEKTQRIAFGSSFSNLNQTTSSYHENGTSLTNKKLPNYSFSISYGVDKPGIGLHYGLMFGEFYRFTEYTGDTYQTIEDLTAYPLLRFRVGSYERFHVEGNIGDDMVYGAYRYLAKVQLKVNLSQSSLQPQIISIGFTDRNQLCMEGDFSVAEQFSIKPSIYFVNDAVFSLGVVYRSKRKKFYYN